MNKLVMISERSQFFNLPVEGEGIKGKESLTSYVSRLCEAHNISVGIFLSKVVIPLIPSNKLLHNEGHQIGKKSSALNNFHSAASVFYAVIENLTCNNNLRSLTLIGFESVMHSFELESIKKWCPVCLFEWKKSNKILYYKLIWNFSLVEVCLEHNCKLVTQCYKCGSMQYVLHAKEKNGYCQKCKAFLGKRVCEHKDFDKELKFWNTWIINNVEELLALSLEERKKINESPLKVADKIYRLLEELKLKTGLTKSEIATLSKIEKSNFCDWQRGEFKPSLLSLLRLLYLCNVKLIDFYSSSYELIATLYELPSYLFEAPINKNRKKFEIEEMRDILKKIIDTENSPPPSLETVARRLGYRKAETIKQRLPDEAAIIIEKHQLYLIEFKKNSQLKLKEELRNIIQNMVNNNIYPSIARIELALNKPAVARNKVIKEMLIDIFNEIGIKRRPKHYGRKNQYFLE